MLNNRKLILDTMCDIYNILKPWCDVDFFDFATHDPVPDSIYVIGRKQFTENIAQIKELAKDPRYTIIFSNVAEGSDTLVSQIQVLGIAQEVKNKEILVLSGGGMGDEYPSLPYDHFLSVIFDYENNHQAIKHTSEIFLKNNKPYTFLFLNGRGRPHRRFLIESLRSSGCLDRALWTNLDGRPSPSRDFSFIKNGEDLLTTPAELKWLSAEYEYTEFRNVEIDISDSKRKFIKTDLFNNLWGEIYLEPSAYVDTYFSLITETVYKSPNSFRTEKIAKPLAMGHPFIVAANTGYYKDLKNLGFRTFDHLIDESFDTIDNHQDRMRKVAEVVQDVVQSDLASFVVAAEDVCKYNQQQLLGFADRVRSELPDRFFNFLSTHERFRLP